MNKKALSIGIETLIAISLVAILVVLAVIFLTNLGLLDWFKNLPGFKLFFPGEKIDENFKVKNNVIYYKDKETRFYILGQEIKERNCNGGEDFVVADIDSEDIVNLKQDLPVQEEDYKKLHGSRVIKESSRIIVDKDSIEIGRLETRSNFEFEEIAGNVIFYEDSKERKTCFEVSSAGYVAEKVYEGGYGAGTAERNLNRVMRTISIDFDYMSHKQILQEIEGRKIIKEYASYKIAIV